MIDSGREVANLTLLTGAALEWNEDRTKRLVYQVEPEAGGGWKQIRQITTAELLGALRNPSGDDYNGCLPDSQ